MDWSQKVAAIGGANCRLLQAGVVKWEEIVTRYRVRTLREVVAINKISLRTMLEAGVRKNIAQGAENAVRTDQAEIIRADRAARIESIRAAGVSQEALVDALARGLTSRVTIVGPTASQSTAPFIARRQGDLLAAELAAIAAAQVVASANAPDEPPPASPAPPVAPVIPSAPIAPPPKPAPPTPAKQPTAFEQHRMGMSKAKVTFEPGAKDTAAKIFGEDITPKRLASIVGSPDDAIVKVTTAEGGKLKATITHPKIEAMSRTIRKEGDNLIVHNDIFMLKREFQTSASKIGLKAFARQVEYSQAAGIDHIETYAYRVKGSIDPATGKERWSGYYVWPRFGYDGPIPEFIKRLPEWQQLPPALQNARDVSELIADVPIGRAWWKQYGDAIDVTFDLHPGSESLKTLNAYLKEALPVVK